MNYEFSGHKLTYQRNALLNTETQDWMVDGGGELYSTLNNDDMMSGQHLLGDVSSSEPMTI